MKCALWKVEHFLTVVSLPIVEYMYVMRPSCAYVTLVLAIVGK